MKRSYRGVILLVFILLLNIVATQQVVNAFFYEKYEIVIAFALANVLLFPLSLWIYRKERDVK